MATIPRLLILSVVLNFTAACNNETASSSSLPPPTNTATTKPVDVNQGYTRMLGQTYTTAAVEVREPATVVHVQEPHNPPNVDAVDINTANADTLSEKLYGIGPKKAQAIIDYRDKYGPFHSLDDLEQVSGIGPKTVAVNKDKIIISLPNANQAPVTVSTPPAAPAEAVKPEPVSADAAKPKQVTNEVAAD